MKTALFLDLDWTLIKPLKGTGKDNKFPIDYRDWTFIEGMPDKIYEFINKGYADLLIIVSNQGGISSNFLTDDHFIMKINHIIHDLSHDYNIPKSIISYYYCPDMEGFYRKPNPGMAYKAALKHEVCISKSIMVGDMKSDEEFSIVSGMHDFMYTDDFLELNL